MVKPKGYFKRPPGPQAGMWSWHYLDKVKTTPDDHDQTGAGFL